MVEQNKIVVVGAGLVGAVLAYGLAALGWQVVLCDHIAIDVEQDFTKFERPISINWFTRTLLHELGLWSDLLPDAVPISKVHVSVADSFGSHVFQATNTPALGYVLSFSLLQKLLWRKVLAHKNIECIHWSGYEKFANSADAVCIEYKTMNGQVAQIQAAACLAVDGTNSYIRDNFLNITTTDGATLRCLAADVSANYLDRCAYQRMSKDGTLALIPTVEPDKTRLMWSMRPDIATKVSAMSNDELVIAANKLLGRKLGCLTACSRKVVLDLPWKIADRVHSGRVLLMGNAAHTIYPAAAQGFNLGMQDISILLYQYMQQSDKTDIVKWFADYVEAAKPLQQKRIAFVRMQHCFGKYTIGQSIMAKALGFMDLLRPVSNAVAATYMGADVDGKYLDVLRMEVQRRKILDAV
jgi:2-octaprenyl-6-methoxyphenol hydroxylase